MTDLATTRRTVLGGIAGTVALGVTSAHVSAATPPPLPSSPVVLNVIDVAGQLQLTQGAIENFVRANPKLISKVNFSQAPAPELPGKIKAQQAAGSVDIDLVMTGTDGLAAGIDGNSVDSSNVRLRRATAGPEVDLFARRTEDARLGTGPGRVRGVLPGRADHRIHARYSEDATEDRAGTARLGEGASEALYLCASGEFRPGPHVPAGASLYPEGQGPDGSKGRLGQDLELSHRAGQVHRILSDRHRRGDEGTGRRHARHDRLTCRLGS